MPEPITFAALLTPPGRGALATIELQGPRAWEITQACLTEPLSPAQLQKPRPWLRQFRSSSEQVEELVVAFPAENVARIHCHGGSAACEAVLTALEASGATRTNATRPLFTQALTERTALILLDQEQGAFSREIIAIQRLIETNALSEARQRLHVLYYRQFIGKHLTKPWIVAIAGRPNAGKSSLLNALLGFQRSITSPTPGTTRDVVTAVTAFDGWPVELRDIAGLRETNDPLERLGVVRAWEEINQANLTILLVPAGEPLNAADKRLESNISRISIPFPYFRVRSKSDLAGATIDGTELHVSAHTGVGLDQLIDHIADSLVPDPPPPGAAVPTTTDQIERLDAASIELAHGKPSKALQELACLTPGD